MLIFRAGASYGQDDESKTFKGYDLDTGLINTPQFAMQMMYVSNFVDFRTADSRTLGNTLGYNSRYFMRSDYWTAIALPQHTNLYGLMSFVVAKEDNATASAFTYTVLNMEVEHFFNEMFKVRFGRLVNRTSQSLFFARLALGEADAHVVGRSPYINDAFEFDLNFKKYGWPVFMFGVKPIFNSVDLGGAYLGAHQEYKNGLASYLVTSMNRTKASDIATIPGYTHDRWYFAWEYELSMVKKSWATFINAGSYVDYVGKSPHMSGNKDLLRGNVPLITDPDDAFRSSMTIAAGASVKPALMSKKLSSFKKVGLEYECTGFAGNKFTSHQVYFFSRMLFFGNIWVSYSYNPQLIRLREQYDIKINDTTTIHPKTLSAATHDIRVSVLFGRFGRFL